MRCLAERNSEFAIFLSHQRDLRGFPAPIRSASRIESNPNPPESPESLNRPVDIVPQALNACDSRQLFFKTAESVNRCVDANP
jgi:hypothetical protein